MFLEYFKRGRREEKRATRALVVARLFVARTSSLSSTAIYSFLKSEREWLQRIATSRRIGTPRIFTSLAMMRFKR